MLAYIKRVSPLGDVLQQTLPASGTGVARTTYTYDLAGRVLTTTDPLGRQAATTYDQAGRVTTTREIASPAAGGAVTSTTSLSYDAASNPISVVKPNTARWSFTYDALSRLRTVTQPTTAAPWAWWKLDETSGSSAANTTDSSRPGTIAGTVTLGQPGALSTTGTSVALNGGHIAVPPGPLRTSTRSYSLWFKTSSSGVLLSKSSAASGTTPTSFVPIMYVGTDGRLRAGMSPTKQITTSTSVANNTWHRAVLNVTPESLDLVVDGVLVGTVASPWTDDYWATFAYIGTGYTAGYPATSGGWMPFIGSVDDVGAFVQPTPLASAGTLATAQIAPTASITASYGYDSAGNQTKTVDGIGQTWWNTYNTWNMPESGVEPSATGAPVEPLADRTFTTKYNSAGLVASTVQPGGVTVTNAYDDLGRVVSVSGTGAPGSKSFTYDALGRVTSTSHPDGASTFAYDDAGALRRSSGAAGTATFAYDGLGRVTTRTDAAGTSSFSYTPRSELYAAIDPVTGKSVVHTYNDASQLTGINYDGGRSAVPARSFSYDKKGRLNQDVMRNGAGGVVSSVAYEYDLNDNVASKTVGPAGVAGAGTNRYFYDLSDRLVVWRGPTSTFTGYAYDRNGNRTRNGAAVATYDRRNRIVSDGTTSYNWTTRGVLASTTTGATTTSFTFDAFGRMTTSGAVSFAYDSLDRAAKRTVGSTTTAFSYSGASNEPTSDGTNVYARLPDGSPLSVAQGANRNFTVADAHGDVTATISAAGAVASTRAYDPFGVVTGSTGTQPSIGYQGDYTDPTTGLVNMGARWYRPTTGSFVSRDSYGGRLDSPVSLNRYTYGSTNPVTMLDPTGHYSEDAAARRANAPKPPPRSDPGEDGRDERAAQARLAKALRDQCIARGDRCKTDQNDTHRFNAMATTLASQNGSYSGAANIYAPTPSKPPPPPCNSSMCSPAVTRPPPAAPPPPTGPPATGFENLGLMCLQLCTGQYLVDALKYSPEGQMVFAIIDGSGKEQLPDGNWSPEDVRDAAGDGDNVAKTLAKLLEDADSTMTDAEFASLTNLTRSVAQRLTGEHDRWEQIDHEQSWWDRNGATVIAIAQIGLSVLAFTGCSALCAAGAAAISTKSAIDACTKSGLSAQCAVSVGVAAVSWAGVGAAAAGDVLKAAGTSSNFLGASLISRATLSTAENTVSLTGASSYLGVAAYRVGDDLIETAALMHETANVFSLPGLVHPATDLWKND